MDVVGEDLTARLIPCLATMAGLEGGRDAIQNDLRAVLTAVVGTSGGAPPASRLTGGRYPVELGVRIERARVVGLKYTVDLVASSASSVLECVWRGVVPVLERFAGAAGQAALRRWVSIIEQRSQGRIDGVYWSVGYTSAGGPRARLYLVGREDALDASVLCALAPTVAHPKVIDLVLAAAESIGRRSVDIVGLALERDGIARSKCYLMTNPYIDLRTVKQLASALDLSAARALSIIRWYRRFIGSHWGQIGSFALGIDLNGSARIGDIEAYAYPSSESSARLIERIEAAAHARRGGGTGALSGLWSLLEPAGSASDGAVLRLSGCSMETGSFGRLGPMTIYLVVDRASAA